MSFVDFTFLRKYEGHEFCHGSCIIYELLISELMSESPIENYNNEFKMEIKINTKFCYLRVNSTELSIFSNISSFVFIGNKGMSLYS